MDLRQQCADPVPVDRTHVGPESHRALSGALSDDLVQAHEGSAADEQNIRRINFDEFLLGMLTPTLRRHTARRAFDQFQERLLHALTRHIAGDGRAFGLAADLINFINVNDPRLRARHIEIRRLQQLQHDVFYIFTDVAGFCQRRSIGNGEGDLQNSREGLAKQCLACPGRSNQKDISFLQLHIADTGVRLYTPVVIVDGHRQHLLGLFLADDIVVEDAFNLRRVQQLE